MKRLLGLAAVLEAATGLAFIIHPPLVTRLLSGDGVSGVGEALGRVAGFALLSLGLACWPDRESAGANIPALRALLTYNPLATLYLTYLGIGGQFVGSMLWPAVEGCPCRADASSRPRVASRCRSEAGEAITSGHECRVTGRFLNRSKQS